MKRANNLKFMFVLNAPSFHCFRAFAILLLLYAASIVYYFNAQWLKDVLKIAFPLCLIFEWLLSPFVLIDSLGIRCVFFPLKSVFLPKESIQYCGRMIRKFFGMNIALCYFSKTPLHSDPHENVLIPTENHICLAFTPGLYEMLAQVWGTKTAHRLNLKKSKDIEPPVGWNNWKICVAFAVILWFTALSHWSASEIWWYAAMILGGYILIDCWKNARW